VSGQRDVIAGEHCRRGGPQPAARGLLRAAAEGALSAGLAACGLPPAEPPPASVMRAPFAVPRNSFFHATLEVPPMQGGELLPADTTTLGVSTDFARSKASGTEDGVPQSYDGEMHNWAALQLRWGLSDTWEAGARATLSGWDEHRDHFTLLDPNGDAIVKDEQGAIDGTSASERHLGLSDIVLEAKRALRGGGAWRMAGLAALKVPVGRPRDLTNAGTFDVSLGLLATRPPDADGGLTWHIDAGAGAPLGGQDLFVDGSDADVRPFAFAGLGATWPLAPQTVMGLQLEGNTSAFEHVPLMDGSPVTLFGGVRTLAGDWILEGGAGTGLNDAAYDWAAHVGATRVF
jgi:hypothetical protein